MQAECQGICQRITATYFPALYVLNSFEEIKFVLAYFRWNETLTYSNEA